MSLRSGRSPNRHRSLSRSRSASRAPEASQPPHNLEASPDSPQNQPPDVPSIKRKPAPRWSLFAFADPFSHKHKQPYNALLSSGVSPEEPNSFPSGRTEAVVVPLQPISESRTRRASSTHLNTSQARKAIEPRNDHYSSSIHRPSVGSSPPSPQSATVPTPATLSRPALKSSDSLVHFEDRGETKVKSPRKSKVDVHWILAYIDDGSYPLIVDLSKRRRDIATILTPGVSWWDTNVLSRPATRPPVTKLRLISPKTLTIDIVNDQAVTVSRWFDPCSDERLTILR